MNIQIDTQNLGTAEKHALIALLTALLPSDPPLASDSLTPAEATTTTAAAVEPEPQAQASTEPTARKRRTKAEIAADEAAAKQETAPAAPVEPATSETTPAPAKLTADELRALLNGYIARHSMEEAIEQLQKFGCNRVTEALALDPEKLAALGTALNG